MNEPRNLPSLSADNLSLVRGSKTVLCDINAAFSPGAITAIVGPNGAGKSSLLMALAGLIPPKQGRVILGEETLHNLSLKDRAKALGFLPQSGEIAWDVTAESLAKLGRMPHGDGASDTGRAAVNSALAALDCTELKDRPARQLSGGERARVLLARVLAGDPQFILADEPLAALDLAHQLSLIAHFKTCTSHGTGVVMVLHDLTLAMNHADHVVVLHQGSLHGSGTPDETLTSSCIADVWGVNAEWQESSVSGEMRKALIVGA